MGDTDADQPAGFGEIKPIAATGQPPPRSARSPSGDALSLPFDGLLVRLQGPDTPLVAQTSISFEAPFELSRRRGLHGFFGDVRCSLDKTAGARTLLFIAMGNATKVVEFPYDQKVQGDGQTGAIQTSSREAVESLFSIERWPSDAESPSQPRPPLVVSIVLLGRRQTPTDDLLVQVTALDLAAVSYDGGAPGSADEIEV